MTGSVSVGKLLSEQPNLVHQERNRFRHRGEHTVDRSSVYPRVLVGVVVGALDLHGHFIKHVIGHARTVLPRMGAAR